MHHYGVAEVRSPYSLNLRIFITEQNSYGKLR